MNPLIESINKIQQIHQISDRQLAIRLKVDEGTISRVKRELVKPGGKVLSALIREFPEMQLAVMQYMQSAKVSR